MNILRAGTFIAINGAVKRKEVVHFIPRHEIEGHDMEEIMKNLTDAFDAHC